MEIINIDTDICTCGNCNHCSDNKRCPSCGGCGSNPDGSTCKTCCGTGSVDD